MTTLKLAALAVVFAIGAMAGVALSPASPLATYVIARECGGRVDEQLHARLARLAETPQLVADWQAIAEGESVHDYHGRAMFCARVVGEMLAAHEGTMPTPDVSTPRPTATRTPEVQP